MSPEERRCLYIATAPLLKEYKPRHALAKPSSPVFAYKVNAMVDEYEAGTAGKQQIVFLLVAIADPVVMVIMRFMKRARPWSRERLENMSHFDPQMGKIGSDVSIFHCLQVF